MGWISADGHDFGTNEGRFIVRWPDGSPTPTRVRTVNNQAYVVISIRGVEFFARIAGAGFEVEVEDTKEAPEEPVETQLPSNLPDSDAPAATTMPGSTAGTQEAPSDASITTPASSDTTEPDAGGSGMPEPIEKSQVAQEPAP